LFSQFSLVDPHCRGKKQADQFLKTRSTKKFKNKIPDLTDLVQTKENTIKNKSAKSKLQNYHEFRRPQKA